MPESFDGLLLTAVSMAFGLACFSLWLNWDLLKKLPHEFLLDQLHRGLRDKDKAE